MRKKRDHQLHSVSPESPCRIRRCSESTSDAKCVLVLLIFPSQTTICQLFPHTKFTILFWKRCVYFLWIWIHTYVQTYAFCKWPWNSEPHLRSRYQFLLSAVHLGLGIFSSPLSVSKHRNAAFCMFFPTVIILILWLCISCPGNMVGLDLIGQAGRFTVKSVGPVSSGRCVCVSQSYIDKLGQGNLVQQNLCIPSAG